MGHRFTFYTESAGVEGGWVHFDRAESHHIGRVLRSCIGQVIRATDGKGSILSVQLEKMVDGCWTGRVLSRIEEEPAAPLLMTVGLPCLKAERWLIALEACCEFGIRTIYPVNFELSVSQWTSTRVDKARRKSVEILKQAGGSLLTRIEEPIALTELLDREDFSEILLADPEGEKMDTLADDALVIVGPEAGFSPREEELFHKVNARRLALSSRRLRSEIAVIAVIALVSHHA
jgi:16S rRNA (uracil1498-N3)-methyltransferase